MEVSSFTESLGRESQDQCVEQNQIEIQFIRNLNRINDSIQTLHDSGTLCFGSLLISNCSDLIQETRDLVKIATSLL